MKPIAPWLVSAATFLSVASIVMVGVNTVLVLENQSAQAEIQQRQLFINQSLQLSRVSEALIKALASASMSGNEKIGELLAQHGISVSPRDASAAAPGNATK